MTEEMNETISDQDLEKVAGGQSGSNDLQIGDRVAIIRDPSNPSLNNRKGVIERIISSTEKKYSVFVENYGNKTYSIQNLEKL